MPGLAAPTGLALGTGLTPGPAMAAVSASLFARLVHNLSQYQEGSETVLDHTFLALLFAEGTTAHNRSIMRHLVAGNGGYIKLGQHIDGGKVHPGKILITGMQSVGLTANTLNELSGTCTAIEV